MLRRFLAWNRRLSDPIEAHLPDSGGKFAVRYSQAVARAVEERPGMTVLDVGAGRRCVFAEYLTRSTQARVIGLDVSAHDLQENRDLADRVLSEAAQLPFADESIDVIVSHSVLEHLPRLDAFFAEANRVLRPGGRFIHLLPSRYALFAMMNRLLPPTLSRRMLFSLRPESKDHSGFVTHYDRCHYSAIRKSLTRSGFSTAEVHVGYCQSAYFGFFLPFFLVSAGYDLLVRTLGIKNLAAQIIIDVRKVS